MQLDELLVDSSTVGIVVQRPDGAIERVNAASLTMLGLTLAQITGRTSIDPRWRAVHVDLTDFPGDQHPAMRVLRTGETVRGEIMGVFNPVVGDYVWITIDAVPLAVDGERWAFVTFVDITELRVAQARAESTLRAVDEHAIVSETDTAGVIVHANDAFCQISGYSRDELIGATHRLLRSGVHSPDFYRDMWDTIVAGGVWHGQICNLRKDGSLYWVQSTISPLTSPVGGHTGYISIRTDITAQVEAAELASKDARTDDLTALSNRRNFDEQLLTQWQRSSPMRIPLALIMLDVDRFKDYNDSWGHQRGDEALQAVAEAVLREVSATDNAEACCARWGGEEFAVLLPGTRAAEAQHLAGAILARVRAANLPHQDGSGPLTLSAGVAVAAERSVTSPAGLVAAADDRLYQAKRAGRDRVSSVCGECDEEPLLVDVARDEQEARVGTRQGGHRSARQR